MPQRSLGGSRMHVMVPNQTRVELAELSKRTGLTVSEHIRRAIDEYLESVLALEKLKEK